MSSCLVRGGMLIDGTGAPGYPADIRVEHGVITEIATALDPRAGESVHDAAGCIVAPGFIESHTHFDGTMWWEPELKPLAGFGATTVIMGNCGFSVAPLPDSTAARDELVKIFSFFEDIPEEPFRTELPWNWTTWSQYKQALTAHVKVPINYGAYVGHIALRLAAMGLDAWERPATAAEIEKMVELLRDALDAGAMGMSSNLMDHDGCDRPVPSLQADDAEWLALTRTLAQYRGRQLQIIVDTFRAMTAPASMERLGRLLEGVDVRVQWGGVPTLEFQRDLMGIQAPLIDMHEKFKQEGRDFWTGFSHVPITATLSVQQSLVFAQSNDYVWHEVVLAPTNAEKSLLLRDPDWRARARASWENDVFDFSPLSKEQSRGMLLLNSDNGAGPVRITLGEYADQLGLHTSDAMAEWLLANGLDSTVTMPAFIKDEDMVVRLLRDPYTVGNITDAGAHGQMLCGGGENILLLTEYVRDKGRITAEEAIHNLTGKLAGHFGLRDRGELKVGKRADITVFDLDEICYQQMEKVYDVPDGKGGFTWRWTRNPAPMRLTLVNGEATFQDGAYTDAKPGMMVSPQQ
ncbi:MAG: amidohydrolase family protein [Halioglobus sp.]